jgi:hypothetical protein
MLDLLRTEPSALGGRPKKPSANGRSLTARFSERTSRSEKRCRRRPRGRGADKQEPDRYRERDDDDGHGEEVRDLCDGWLRYNCLRIPKNSSKGRVGFEGGLVMAGFVEGIFLAPGAGAEMKSVRAATALEGCGLKGDRYCAGTGHWSRFGRVCEATFISAEDLDDIERERPEGKARRAPAQHRNQGEKPEDLAARRTVPCGEGCLRVPRAALGLPVHRASYRTGYDAGPKGSRWYLREGSRERHAPSGRRDRGAVAH